MKLIATLTAIAIGVNMTIPAQPGSSLFSPTSIELLLRAIGGTQDQDTTSTGTNTSTTNQTSNTTNNTSGTTGTNTSGNRTGTNSTMTTNSADIAQLMDVFNQQRAGITPEALAAIFSEGAKQAPGLIAATANAVGARASNNTPLATALTQLSGNLTNQAARLSLDQLNQSGTTAGRIAELTRSSTTTGMNSENSNQTSTGTNTSTSTQTGNQNTNTSGTNTTNSNTQVDNQPNYGNLTQLLGLLLGGSVLNNGLSNFGGVGGALTSGTNALGQIIRNVLGGNQGDSQTAGPVPTSGIGFQPFSGANPPLGMNPAIGLTPEAADLIQNSLGGTDGFGNTVTTPAQQVTQGQNLTGGIGAGFNAGLPGFDALFRELGLTNTSTEADFWEAIGIDPNTLSPIDVPGATDLGDLSWWDAEGWGNLDPITGNED